MCKNHRDPFARASEERGSILALWGSQYGHRGVPGDASEAEITAAVEHAIERRDTHA